MNDDMGFDEKMKELYGALYDALSGMADKVNGALNSKGFQINARRVLASRLREAAERPDLSWPALCDVLCVSGRKEAVRALAAMVDPKYAPTEKERRILDMWPKFEDGEYLWFGDAYVDTGGDANEVQAVELSEACADLVGLEGFHTVVEPGERVKRPGQSVLDADGVEIKVGDTVWIISECTETPGEPYRVKGINKYGEVLLDFHFERSTGMKGEYLTHTSPDSWERLEEDAEKNPFDYCKDVGHRLDTCENSEAYKARDIVRRAKKLVGVER